MRFLKNAQPLYKLHPAIGQALLTTKINIPVEEVRFPFTAFTISLHKDLHIPTFGPFELCSLLVSEESHSGTRAISLNYQVKVLPELLTPEICHKYEVDTPLLEYFRFDDSVIDVDSYQTPSFPATAIMESIRDRHNKNFNVDTDWFSFAVTSFQMFRGIHPYKGKHPNIKGLDDRMMANISVLHPDVKYPKAVLPVTVVPQAYLDWYKAVFHDGKRVPPPADMQSVFVVVPRLQTISGSGNIKITEMPYKIAESIRNVYFSNGFLSVMANTQNPKSTKNENVLYNNGRPACRLSGYNHMVAFTDKTNEPVVTWRENDKLKLTNGLRTQEIAIDLDAESVMEYNGRILVKNGPHIYEINLTKAGNDISATPSLIGNVLPQASRLYSGVAMQNMLGTPFVSLFPDRRSCYQVKVPELIGYKVIDAKFDDGVLMAVGVKNNKYDRLVFRFDKTYTKYDLRKVEDITYTGINFVTLDTGICVCLNEEEKIEAFSSKINSSTIKLVEDTALDGDMRLFKMGGKLGFYRGNKVYSMRMS